jgi:Domain of unknown function (DUF5679)/Phospholipase A2-like domain
MNSFCLKCKRKTESINEVHATTKNNRLILKSSCVVCGGKKSQFLKQVAGKGLFNDGLSNLGVELHLPASEGEYVAEGSFNNLNKYSYCGPGTKFTQRDKEGYQGINELDKMCKLHDRFYTDNSDTASRNISDEALAHRASEIADDLRFDDEQRRFAKYVAIVMKNKARFGFGIKTKNVKMGP